MTEGTHLHIDCEEDIPDLCKNVFLTSRKFLGMVWVLSCLLLGTLGGCLTWALTTSSSVVKLEEGQKACVRDLSQIKNEINTKLDILIDRK